MAKDGKGLDILLVDDDRGLLEILGALLQLEGHRVVSASSAHEGLQRMKDHGFDLVLADLKMPRTTGLDMLRAIQEEYPSTPVVIMTAYASVDTTVEAMRLGVYDYLPKPFKLADLRTVISRVESQK
ncbi:MAG TPA: response regulator [Armatimonadota bacterium]|jgi:DNA-binding NtrC family response regulator